MRDLVWSKGSKPCSRCRPPVVEAVYMRARLFTGSQKTNVDSLGSTAWTRCERCRSLGLSVQVHGHGGHS